jgi:hypothetical protein
MHHCWCVLNATTLLAVDAFPNPFGNRPAEITAPFPKRESRKNNSGIRGAFLRLKKHHPIHHKSPRFHHKFTIKKPRFAPRFFKNPQQKRKKLPQKKITQIKRCGPR